MALKKRSQPSKKEPTDLQPLIQRYRNNLDIFKALADAIFRALSTSTELAPHVHSMKVRVKDPVSLKKKLEKKAKKGNARTITEKNIFQSVNDLVGLRILHLHTSQFAAIDQALRACLLAENYDLVEGPIAKTWDIESKAFFESLHVETEDSPSQYTSVHYVFSAKNDMKTTFEIQVRTLAEELWGEVNHKINYPDEHPALTCREQIAVLARVTSSCTRLVDSIFRADGASNESSPFSH